MSSLALQILFVSETGTKDTIVFVPTSEDGKIDYLKAEGIIRRLNTSNGESWLFTSLMSIDGRTYTGVIEQGSLSAILNTAKYQCGDSSASRSWTAVNYSDTSFSDDLFETCSGVTAIQIDGPNVAKDYNERNVVLQKMVA